MYEFLNEIEDIFDEAINNLSHSEFGRLLEAVKERIEELKD